MSADPTRHVVHIGYHKTASTWFQRIYYPNVTNAAFVARETVERAFLDDGALHWDSGRARELLGLDDGRRRILCEEDLSGYLHNGGLFGCLSKDMVGRLHATVPDSDIVIFVRSQPSIIAACYAQYIRGGGTHSVNRYLWPRRYLSRGAESRYFKIPRFSFDHFDYWPLVERYVATFGRERVHVFAWEMLRDDRAGFLDQFEARLGLVADRPAVAEAGRRNVSYSGTIMQLARFLNLFTRRTVQDKYYLVHIPSWYSLRRLLLENLNRLPLTGSAPGPERLLGAANLDFIGKRYRDGNRRLAAEFDLPLERLGYPV